MEKSEIRKIYRAKRNSLSQENVIDLSEMIFKNFRNRFEMTEHQKVHIFLPILKFNEIDTFLFINYFFENNIRVFVPKMIENDLISVEIFPDSQYVKNSWGIPEPSSDVDSAEKDFDFVITPLLYCDHLGNRIGYGKGFYDEFFRSISAHSKKIGVNYFNPKEMIDDVWAKDVPLDYLVTPTDVLSFLDGF